MAEADAIELREGLEEVRGEPLEGGGALVVGWLDLAAEVIDGVVTAPAGTA
jgi:hypothetical protein